MRWFTLWSIIGLAICLPFVIAAIEFGFVDPSKKVIDYSCAEAYEEGYLEGSETAYLGDPNGPPECFIRTTPWGVTKLKEMGFDRWPEACRKEIGNERD